MSCSLRFQQDMVKDRMEGAKINRIIPAQQFPETLLHCLRGFFCKGDNEDFFGWNALFDQIKNTVCDGIGFPGAGARQQEQRPLSPGDSTSLCLIHLTQIRHFPVSQCPS